jgi:hypothetical protein
VDIRLLLMQRRVRKEIKLIKSCHHFVHDNLGLALGVAKRLSSSIHSETEKVVLSRTKRDEENGTILKKTMY